MFKTLLSKAISNKYVQIAAIIAVVTVLWQCNKPQPPLKKTETTVNVNSNTNLNSKKKSQGKTKTDIKVTKPDGTKIETTIESDILTEEDVSLLKNESVSIHKKEEINLPAPRFFYGPAVSVLVGKREITEYQFGGKIAYRFDSALTTAAAYPTQQRVEASVLIPLK